MTVCFWPIPAPHGTFGERLLLVKADVQNEDLVKTDSERLLHPQKQTLGWYALNDCC